MNRLKQHMNEALSDIKIDSKLTESVLSRSRKTHHYGARPLIAACVILLCVVTVAAAVSSGFSLMYEESNLHAEFTPTPVVLSAEVEAKLEQLITEHGEDYGKCYFSTLSAAESYLGITFLHSDLLQLENAPSIDEEGNPLPDGINMIAGRATSDGKGYWANLSPNFTCSIDSDMFSVFMTIQLYTEETDYIGGVSFLNVENCEFSDYTAPSGITASVAIFDADGHKGNVSAHFVVDGVGYNIQVYGQDMESTRQALYAILDSLH